MISVVKLTLRQGKAALALLFLFLAACGGESPDAFIKLSGPTMGTQYHISLRRPEGIDQAELQRQLDVQLVHFNGIASTYIEDSELNRLNAAPVGEWQTLSEPLYSMIALAIEISWLSGGAFDMTVGPLVDLWGFGPVDRQGVPADEEIAAAMAQVGYDKLELDMLEARVRKLAPLRLDLSAIAKGYAVDAAASWLRSLGVTDFLVEIGGEMRVSGLSPRGDHWRVGVESPDNHANEVLPIRLDTIAVATSGDYRNYFEQDGVRYSHTIDPTTGRPIVHNLASVTVLDSSCAFADAMATAFSVMGADRALQLAEKQSIPVYVIEKTERGFSARYSSSFAPYLEQLDADTANAVGPAETEEQ